MKGQSNASVMVGRARHSVRADWLPPNAARTEWRALPAGWPRAM